MVRTLRRSFDAEVVTADTTAEALGQLGQGGFALVLVNRVLDADGSSGLDLIRQVKADEALRQVPVMLVSNYEDAQQEAVRAGAEPGFGKSALGRPEMLARVGAFLCDERPASAL
jgi:two-component system chemotaxis response regulator CheY